MMYPWQMNMLKQLEGFKPGEMVIMMAGRNAGKSHWTNVAVKRLMDDLNNRPIEDLVLSQGTVYGTRYYTVEPIGGNWMEMEIWCLDTYGDPGKHIWGDKEAPEPQQRWYMNNRKFWFRNKKDLNWFILKWQS